jgi:hypothetical protein
MTTCATSTHVDFAKTTGILGGCLGRSHLAGDIVLAEPRNNSNPRYHAFSAAISFLLKVTDELRAEG